MADVYEYDTVAANNNTAPPDGWPENMPYDDVNNCAREMQAADARDLQDRNGTLQATGTGGAYAVTLNRSSISAYFDGLIVGFRVVNGYSSGAITLNVNGIGAEPVILPSGDDPIFYTDSIYQVVWNDTLSSWQVISQVDIELVTSTISNESSDRDFASGDLNGPIIRAVQAVTLTIPSTLSVVAGDRIRLASFNTLTLEVEGVIVVTIEEDSSFGTTITAGESFPLPYTGATLIATSATSWVLVPGIL